MKIPRLWRQVASKDVFVFNSYWLPIAGHAIYP